MCFNLHENSICLKKTARNFCFLFEKVPEDGVYALWVRNFVKITLSHTISEINMFYGFYAELQDGFKKWQENNFHKKVPDDPAYNLRAKNFIEI